MRSARSLALRSAAREASGVPAAGPAMTVLGTMLTRIAAIIRGVAAGYVLVQVAIWHAYYQASPGRLWGPAVAVGWAAGAVWYLRRRQFPPWPLVGLDWAVYAVLAMTAGGCVPLAIRGQAGEWLFVTVASGLLVQVWFTPVRLSMLLSLASGLAFWAGILVGTESAAPLFVGALAVILPIGMLLQVLATLDIYRQPLAAVAVWLGILLTAAWLVPRALSRGLTRPEAVLAVAVAVAAVTAIGLDRRTHLAIGSLDWAILGTVWLLALVALSRSAWLWVPGAVLVFVAHAFFVVNLLGATPLGLARVAAGGYAMGVVLAIFAALRPTLRTHSEIAVRRAGLRSRSAAERAAVAAIHADRADRMALLEVEALPLLRGIADGSLDPADAAVRRKCAEHATTLRRALVHRTGQAGGVLAALGPALATARARDMPVEIQVVGQPGQPDRAVAQATLAAVHGMIRALPPQQVILTVLSAGDAEEVYLTFRLAPAHLSPVRADLAGLVPPGPAAAWRVTLDAEPSRPGCLEVSWRKAAG